MPRNSASINIHRQALPTKASTRNSTACTGLRAVMTPRAEPTTRAASMPKMISWTMSSCPLAVARVGRAVGGDLRFEPVTHGQELLLGHDLLAGLLEVEVGDAGLHDGVHRAGLLAEAAVDALEQVDVIARGAAGAVGAHLRVDGDGQRRAHRLAELAGDAAFLAVGV